ncbi:unnamed protein product [Linum trigynum]|uniref:Uncharacterized protein n=1 Tax=Linum trigynum TaxID=586398 RepID=A0AAV2FU46_9ROSI
MLGLAGARRLGRRSPRRSWEEQEAGRRRCASPRPSFTSKKLGGAGGWEEEEEPAERSSARGERWPPRQIPAASTSPGREEKDRCWLWRLRDGVGFCYVN